MYSEQNVQRREHVIEDSLNKQFSEQKVDERGRQQPAVKRNVSDIIKVYLIFNGVTFEELQKCYVIVIHPSNVSSYT